MKDFGLYIHIPFCSKKCDYCDFVSFSLDENAQKSYLEALCREIDLVKDKYKAITFSTIFIGGGTPSIVFDGFFKALTKKLYSCFKLSKKLEFTIEANPHSLTEDKLKEYLSCGVNRISLGVQSLDQQVLGTIHRTQSPKDVYRAFRLLKRLHVSNVNADIIVGLPNQSYASIIRTANYLKSRVQHISVYGLQLEEDTPLYRRVKSHELQLPDDDMVADFFQKTAKILKRAGFNQYEISNFAKPGYECRHNQLYWDGSNYLGIGVAAHSFVDSTRFCNTSNFTEYINLLKNSRLPTKDSETLTSAQKREECIMLSLRTSKGLSLKEFSANFNENLLISKKKQIERLIELKKLEIKDGFLKISEGNQYLSNAIILELL